MRLLLFLTAAILGSSAQTTICGNPGYSLRGPANEYCYRYYQSFDDFSASNRSCVRDKANLVFIDDDEENMYLGETFFQPNSETEFWIGLNDIDTEGVFRWLNSNTNSSPSYLNWAGGFPVENTNALDCVKFSNDGWRVHTGLCTTSKLPRVCKMRSCLSRDGVSCIDSEPTNASSVAIEVIIIPIVLVIFIILIIVIILFLVCLWKFNNDVFQQYCCCCFFGGSKSAVHSMQQENQRLRHELSQHKVSLSGRYQPGQFTGDHELSGVPDGKGGVLPTIKRPPPGSNFSPTIEEGRVLGFPANSPGSDVPPPLVLQRPSLPGPAAYSRNPSQTSASFFFGNPHSRPVRQSLPAGFGLPARPSIPAPIRGVGGYVPGASSKVVSSNHEGPHEGDSRSESSESEQETAQTS